MERAERVVLGIDVGGTKVCVGVVTEDGRVVEKQRYPHRNVPVEEWTKELMAQTDALLERCGMRDRIAAGGIGWRGGVGVSLPGQCGSPQPAAFGYHDHEA